MKAVDVKALGDFRIKVVFDDGVSGVVDLSDLIRKGIFKVLQDPKLFGNVTTDGVAISWNEQLEIDAFKIYADIVKKSPSDLINNILLMPQISMFLGIIIRMFFDDHNPPHFHASYAEHQAIIDIQKLELWDGFFTTAGIGPGY